jgi:hypothetical protein
VTHEEYDAIYSQDTPVEGKPHGWIQWKGTDVCVDLTCACGHHGHIDGEFFYGYRCSKCGAHYAVGQNIVLIPLSEQQVASWQHEFDSDVQ